MTTMTSRERMLTAMRNQQPDRVPAAPDISNYLPAKKTGLPFWDIFWKGALPLWQAYLTAADDYGIDAWTAPVMGFPCVFPKNDRCDIQFTDTYDKSQDAMVRKTLIKTPDGNLDCEEICFRYEPPTAPVKLVKNLVADFPKLKWTYQMPEAIDHQRLDVLRDACHRRNYAFGVTVGYPGFHGWAGYMHGGVEAVSYAEMDTPEILEEWCALDLARLTRVMELIVQSQKVDYILFGGSGTITLASPALARKYALPALKQLSRLAQAAGIPTMLHSCGKSQALADMLAAETDVNMLNPLEVPPMGDINLAAVKRQYGRRLALMGNLHTTNVMLRGTVRDVRRESLKAIRDAGAGGGFILSTGDQCGRETPDANVRELVNVANEFGHYPLDLDVIAREIGRLS